MLDRGGRTARRLVFVANVNADTLADYADRVVAGVRSGERASLQRLRKELRGAASGASRYESGFCDALVAIVDAALVASTGRPDLAPQATLFEPGSLAERLLLEIASGVRGANTDLAVRLDTDEWQVSRAGRRLRELGLAARVRTGRLNAWELTRVGQDEAARLLGSRRHRA